jgi:hypothetical protein
MHQQLVHEHLEYRWTFVGTNTGPGGTSEGPASLVSQIGGAYAMRLTAGGVV